MAAPAPDPIVGRRALYSQFEETQNRAVDKGGSLFGYTYLYGGVPGAEA